MLEILVHWFLLLKGIRVVMSLNIIVIGRVLIRVVNSVVLMHRYCIVYGSILLPHMFIHKWWMKSVPAIDMLR
jgi:hypothetical protein